MTFLNRPRSARRAAFVVMAVSVVTSLLIPGQGFAAIESQKFTCTKQVGPDAFRPGTNARCSSVPGAPPVLDQFAEARSYNTPYGFGFPSCQYVSAGAACASTMQSVETLMSLSSSGVKVVTADFVPSILTATGSVQDPAGFAYPYSQVIASVYAYGLACWVSYPSYSIQCTAAGQPVSETRVLACTPACSTGSPRFDLTVNVQPTCSCFYRMTVIFGLTTRSQTQGGATSYSRAGGSLTVTTT